MILFRRLAAAAVALTLGAGAASAQTEIQWWHAMGGALGETVNDIAAGFNRSQTDFVVKAVYKGNYTETMTAGVAAFRSGEPPHIMQVFEVGTATMMAAKGAIYPVYQLMADQGLPFDEGRYISGFFDVSNGIEEVSERGGDQVDHGDVGGGVSVSACLCPSGLEETVEALHAGVAVA